MAGSFQAMLRSHSGAYELRALVEEVRRVAQDAEAVREPGRNPELAWRGLGQLDGDPAPEARRAPPDVHRDVPHRATEDLHQLPLRPGLLEVQAAQRAQHRAGVVVLHERADDSRLGVPACLECLVEESAGVAVHLRFDQEDLGEVGGCDLHPIAPRCSRRSSR